MEGQIKKSMPFKVESEGLNRIISINNELDVLIREPGKSNLERIINLPSVAWLLFK